LISSIETGEVLEWRKRVMLISNQIDNASQIESSKIFHSYVKHFIKARVQEIIALRPPVKIELENVQSNP
jgi:hypothetical protein